MFLRILPFHLRWHPARMCRSAAASPFQTGTNSMGGAPMAPVTVGWLPGPQTEDPEGLSGFSPETLILSLVLVVGLVRNSRPPPFLLSPHQCIFLFPCLHLPPLSSQIFSPPTAAHCAREPVRAGMGQRGAPPERFSASLCLSHAAPIKFQCLSMSAGFRQITGFS